MSTAKHAGDLVTSIDRHIERQLRAEILAKFPEDGILGEEFENSEIGNAEYVWILDPIDGTANFARGVPYFCTVGALVRQGELLCSVIADPNCNDVFAAVKGGGLLRNGSPPAVRTAWPEGARPHFGLGYSEGQSDAAYCETFVCLRNLGFQPRELCAGALMIAHTAVGQIDGYFERQMLYWDAAPALLMAREMGLMTADFPFAASEERRAVFVVRPEHIHIFDHMDRKDP